MVARARPPNRLSYDGFLALAPVSDLPRVATFGVTLSFYTVHLGIFLSPELREGSPVVPE